MNFKVGDKVRAKKGAPYSITTNGWEGTVKEIKKYGFIGVKDYCNELMEFDVKAKYFDLVKRENECIVIYRKDNETIALDKRNGKKAVAKCSPEDEYDFETGAKLAFERLTNHVTFRLLCIKDGSFYTKGKVYEFIDGVAVWDKGYKSFKYDSLDAFKHDNPDMFKNCFVELKAGDNPEEILKKYEEKQPLNTKIIFTKGDDVFKTGHIYKIKNGKLQHPVEGDFLPYRGACFNSIEDVKDYFTGHEKRKHNYGWSCETLEFIEVVDD